MCGIVGYTGKKQAAGFLLDGLSRLEYRGYDSAGIALLNNGTVELKKTVGRISTLAAETDNGAAMRGTVGIGHTRWATHGAPSVENAHPHTSQNGKFAVVHNGIIENYTALRQELTAQGAAFRSETDTEVVPQLLEKYYEGDLLEAVRRTVARLEGSYALGIICADVPDTIVAVRQFSPLIIGVSADANMIVSDVTAAVSHTKEVIYLEDHEIALLTPDSVAVYDASLRPVTREISHITWDVSSAEKDGYAHFMLKEIMEQPRAVRQTAEGRVRGDQVVFDGITLTAERLRQTDRIVILACGSAYHAGVVGKYVLETLLRIPVEVDLASEFRYRDPVVNERTLAIVISQSGETADTLAALQEAKRRGAHTLSVVNTVGSSIAKASDDVLYTRAGPEIAVATTKGYSTQLAVLYLFGVWAAHLLHSTPEKELDALLRGILALPAQMEQTLLCAPEMRALAEECGAPASLFFIGRNIDYATALEASLKLKEISYLHSEAYAAGELKHGTISLVEEGTPVIALACCERLSEKMLGNIREVRARGANVIACTHGDRPALEEAAQRVVHLPQTHPLLTASLEVLPFQLFAYYTALGRGCDIDKPRNLAKSVTVE